MAVTAVAVRTSAKAFLSAGTDESGKAITKSVTLSGLRSNPDGVRIYDVVDLLAPCLAYPVADVQTTEVKHLEKV